MGELEREITVGLGPADLVVVDGPLTGRAHVPGAVGLVKTHRVMYLPPALRPVLGDLAAGERTPLFVTTTVWSRYSWYFRLPGSSGYGLAGVVRCEASADLPVGEAAQWADLVTVTLPRFASSAHKDPQRSPEPVPHWWPGAGTSSPVGRPTPSLPLAPPGERTLTCRASG